MFFNFNKDTIGVFKTMSLGSLLHKDKITDKNNEYNRFLYPIMFLSQPIISDYVKIINAGTLEEVKELKGKFLIALAVWIGKTRLIDNVILKGFRVQ